MDPVPSEDIEAVRDMVTRFMQTEVVPVMDGLRDIRKDDVAAELR